MNRGRRAVSLALGAIVACEVATDSVLSLLGEPCYLDSDCNGELVCVYQTCHAACDATRDCATGRCILGQDGVHVCQPAEDVPCGLNSDCPEPLVCAVDGQCRNECLTASDCVSGQLCAGGACAEPDELDENGELPQAGSGDEGERCMVNSDCAGQLLCIEQRCLYECEIGDDCPSGICTDNHCTLDPALCVPGDQRVCPADQEIPEECEVAYQKCVQDQYAYR